MRSRAFCRALAVIGLLGAVAGTQAATITVTNLNAAGAGSLRRATSNADQNAVAPALISLLTSANNLTTPE